MRNNLVVDIEGLAGILKCKPATLRHHWRDFPHFFIGRGDDLRGARFDVDDVLIYLKEHRGCGYECLAQSKGALDRQVQVAGPAVQAPGPHQGLSLIHISDPTRR